MYNPDAMMAKIPADNESAYEIREMVAKYVAGLKKDPVVTHNVSSYVDFIKLYRDKKQLDLEAEFRRLPQSNHTDAIKSQFFRSKEHGEFAQFAELLPLLANKEGRLGKICKARITKTAKPDDEGNSRVDLVFDLSIDREYLKANPDLADIKPTVTFLVDVTTYREKFDEKEARFHKVDLLEGKKGRVLCYENAHKQLGIEAPKCLVLRSEDHLASVAKKFRSAVRPMGDDGFIITNDKLFDEEFLKFFVSFIKAARENMENNVGFISDHPQESRAQRDLSEAYQTLIKFLEVYERTLGTDENQYQGS